MATAELVRCSQIRELKIAIFNVCDGFCHQEAGHKKLLGDLCMAVKATLLTEPE